MIEKPRSKPTVPTKANVPAKQKTPIILDMGEGSRLQGFMLNGSR